MGEKASLYFPLGTNSITQLVSYRFEHSERRARKAASGAQRGSPRFQGTEGREERGEELGGGGGVKYVRWLAVAMVTEGHFKPNANKEVDFSGFFSNICMLTSAGCRGSKGI